MKPLDEAIEARLVELLGRVPRLDVNNDTRYVIFSDLHIGNGGKSDDFLTNSELFFAVAKTYDDMGYHFILNGDIEELARFSLGAIRARWAELYEFFAHLQGAGRLSKIAGNHDIALLTEGDPQLPVEEGLCLQYGSNSIFVYHGHQIRPYLQRENKLVTFVLRHIATPLGIRNYTIRHDSRKKYKVERGVYEFSARHGLVSIIGHTHRPLFESMSKYDSLRFEIERLCRKYPKVGSRRRERLKAEIEFLRAELLDMQQRKQAADFMDSLYDDTIMAPCIFNSGTVIGRRGITCLEIANGEIALIHYFDGRKYNRKHQQLVARSAVMPGLPYYRREVRRDRLEWIFARITVLGGLGPRADF